MSRRSRRIERLFPRLLTDGYERYSPQDFNYNCASFAAGDTFRWWDGYGLGSGYYWPPSAQKGSLFKHLISAYKAVGFENCDKNTKLEMGYEKVALYMDDNGEWTHVSRQRTDGWWESKLGESEDIVHRLPESLAGPDPAYGTIQLVMRRSLVLGAIARSKIRKEAIQLRLLKYGGVKLR